MIPSQLKYKTAWSDGSILVAADRFFPSSKTCSECGAVRAKYVACTGGRHKTRAEGR
jgi:transposase